MVKKLMFILAPGIGEAFGAENGKQAHRCYSLSSNTWQIGKNSKDIR